MAIGLLLVTIAANAQPVPTPRPRELGEQRKDFPSAVERDHPLKRLGADELRTRMRVCAVRWQRMKRDGDADEILWSDFARECLDTSTGN